MDFSQSIKTIKNFTRPIKTVVKNFGPDKAIPGSGTLFFVNNQGVAITCKHISSVLKNVTAINKKWLSYLKEKALTNSISDQKALQTKYGFTSETAIQIIYTIVESFDLITSMTIHEHPEYDLSIIKFNGFNEIKYSGHAVFPAHNNFIEQGKFCCRLGFPFPEFSNFNYNDNTGTLQWTRIGNQNSPIFPIEGMVTRKINDKNGIEYGIELSRPGLRGQSGGPLFNEEGLILGVQSATKHIHLGFDIINKEEYVRGRKIKISNYPYLDLGICINHIEIKKWLDRFNVSYTVK